MVYFALLIFIFAGMQMIFRVLGRDPLDDGALHLDIKKKAVGLVASLVPLRPVAEMDLQRKLTKAGFEKTPKDFLAEGVLKVTPFIAVSIFFLVNKNLFLALWMLIIAAIFYRLHRNRLHNRINHINRLIIAELPEFFSYVSNSLKTSKDITAIIGAYLQVANPAFKSEIMKLHADLKTGNIDEALLDFDMRLNIPHLSSFISAVRATLDGEIQDNALDALTIDIEFYENEEAKKRAEKVPGKVAKASFAVAVMTLIYFVTLMVYALILGLNHF